DEGATALLTRDEAFLLQARQHMADGHGGDPKHDSHLPMGGELHARGVLAPTDALAQHIVDPLATRTERVDQHAPPPSATCRLDVCQRYRGNVRPVLSVRRA